jgi:hypothetical protein
MSRLFSPSARPRAYVALGVGLCALFLSSQTQSQGLMGSGQVTEENIAFREARDLARRTGFSDLEVDILHGQIAGNLNAVLQIPGLPEEVGQFNELIETADAKFFVRGKDRQGRPYLRVTLREGYSFSTEVFPVQYIFRAHCYMFPSAAASQNPAPAAAPAANPDPAAAGQTPPARPNLAEMDRIIFQFYRVNYSGAQYTRELRRIIHPNPKNIAQPESRPIGAELSMLDNSQLTLEQYEEPSNTRPVWEGSDGVPLPDLDIQPKQRVVLNDRNDPVDYGRQIRILNRYKRLLRKIDFELARRLRVEQLERGRVLERILDFPT